MVKFTAYIVVFLFLLVDASFSVDAALVVSSAKPKYVKVKSSFKNSFKGKVIDSDINSDGLESSLEKVSDAEPRVIVTVGDNATNQMSKSFPDLPIVYSLTSRTELEGDNIAGVDPELPAAIKFDYIKKIFPKAKKIGVIYSKDSKSSYSEVKKQASQKGFKIVGVEVKSSKEVAGAFKSIAKKIDVFLILKDRSLNRSASVRLVLVEGLKHKVPVVGLSASFTKIGATCSFELDYDSVGKQVAKIAEKVSKGTVPSSIGKVDPDGLIYSLNLNSAKKVGHGFSKDIVANASKVF